MREIDVFGALARLLYQSGQICENFDATFKIRTNLTQNCQNLSGQDWPSAEQTFDRIIRGPHIIRNKVGIKDKG